MFCEKISYVLNRALMNTIYGLDIQNWNYCGIYLSKIDTGIDSNLITRSMLLTGIVNTYRSTFKQNNRFTSHGSP